MIDQRTLDDAARFAIELLLNSLWQSALVTLVAAVVLRIFPRVSAATRCAVWSATLAALVLIPIASGLSHFIRNAPTETKVIAHAVPGTAIMGTGVDESAGVLPETVPQMEFRPVVEVRGGRWALWAFAAVLLASGIRLCRVAVGAIAIWRMRRRCSPVQPDDEVALTGWSRAKRTGRRAALALSPDARVPMVLGIVRPLVAIPEDLFERLSDADLDQISLHELAHVRRHDDWAKLGQSIVEALGAFNPASFWLGRRIDAEREVACDDWVVSLTQERRRYAQCLLKLAGLRLASNPVPAPGALGRKPLISERIELVMQTNRNTRPKPTATSRLAIVASLAVITGCSLVAGPAIALSRGTIIDTPPAGGLRDATPPSEPEPSALASRGDKASVNQALLLESRAAIERDDTVGEDARVRHVAVEALGDRAGTVVVLDARDGRVRTVVNQDWAYRRGFPPCSTIKLVTALAALESGDLDPSASVIAMKQRVNLDSALATSNTEYFQRVGERTGFERFLNVARQLGFGEPTGASTWGEYAGQLPTNDPETSKSVFGVGTGFEVTAAQLAVATAAIGNGGTLFSPQVDRTGLLGPIVRRRIDLSEPSLHRVLPGMIGAVRYGTATGAALKGIDVAGKTGTAGGPDGATGLFVSFAPARNPSVVVVVVLRGGDVMGRDAASVAGIIYSALGAELLC